MRIRAFLFSCAPRAVLRAQTLAGLRGTDWRDEVTVVLDTSTAVRKQERVTETALRLVHLALAQTDWDYLLFLEDDLAFNRHLRHNLLSWRPLQQGGVQLAGLYNPGVRSLRDLNSLHYFVADPNAVYGSQAFLIERGCARFLVDHFHEVEGMQDIRFPLLAARRGPIFYHAPSLVQHVGVESVWGGPFHQAADFDPEFRNRGKVLSEQRKKRTEL